MAAPLRQPLAPEVVLGREGEEEWQRFRRQLDLHDGFWLGFLFTDAFTVSRAFRTRTEGILRLRARHLLHLAPSSPQVLEATVTRLFDQEAREADLVWIEPAWGDLRTGDVEKAWNRAWDRFFLRLNERRDRLRENLDGALLLVAPRPVKPRVRDAAPDLWSIRAMVLEVAGPPPEERRLSLEVGVRETWGDEALEPLRGLRTGTLRPPPEVQALLRRAEGHLASGSPEFAIPEAAEAIVLLEQEELPITGALWILARAEAAAGDLAAALDHAEIVVQQSDERDAGALDRLTFFARLLDQSELPVRAEEALRQAVLLARELATRQETPGTEQRLVRILGELGHAVRRQGRLGEAGALYEQSVEVSRKLLDKHGENEERLQNLAVSLDRLGGVLFEQGNDIGARRSLEESQEITLRLLKQHGEGLPHSPNLARLLISLGDVLLKQGDERGARRSYEEALALASRLTAEHGKTPELLAISMITLDRLGVLLLKQGDATGARPLVEESLGFARRLLTEQGDNPERLRNEAISLGKLGDVLARQGDDAASLCVYEESLAVLRRLFSEYGESPDRLRDLGMILIRLGDVEKVSGRAPTYLREAIELFRRIIDRYGETEPRRRDLVAAERRLEELAESPDHESAARAFE